jgi:hypothetical protein
MAVLFEMVNNSAAYDAVDVPEDLRWFQNAVGYRVYVVRHYYVGIDRKACRFSGFAESVAGDYFDLVSAKNRQTVFGYGGDVKSRSVS